MCNATELHSITSIILALRGWKYSRANYTAIVIAVRVEQALCCPERGAVCARRRLSIAVQTFT